MCRISASGNQRTPLRYAAGLLLLTLLWVSLPLTPLRAAPPPPSIYGYVWHDWDENGLLDPGEPLLPNVLLVLADPQGHALRATHSSGAGLYQFVDLASGDYVLAETDPEGFTPTTPNLVAVHLDAQTSAHLDFGDVLTLGCTRRVYGEVWQDANANGLREAEEAPLAGVGLRLLDTQQRLIGVTVSQADGAYVLSGMPSGRYYVALDPPAGAPISAGPLHWGVDLRACQSARIPFGLQSRPEPSRRQDTARLEAAVAAGNSVLSGAVSRLESDPSGTLARQAIAGITLTLTNAAGQVVEVQRSDDQGRYRFAGLAWDYYYLRQESVPGCTPVLAGYWGVAPSGLAAADDFDILIDLENRIVPVAPPLRLLLPYVMVAR